MPQTTASLISGCSCSLSSRCRSRSRTWRSPCRSLCPSGSARAGSAAVGPAGAAAATSAATAALAAARRCPGEQVRGGAGEQGPLLEQLGAERRADRVSLHLVAAEAAQPEQLALGLDSLGDHPQPEAVPEIDDRPDDHLVVRVV